MQWEGAEQQNETVAWVTGNSLEPPREPFPNHLFCSSNSSGGLFDYVTHKHISTHTFKAVCNHLFHPELWDYFNKPHPR